MKEATVLVLVILILFFTGCNNIGMSGHQVFTKDGHIQEETISQIMSKLGYDNSHYLDMNASNYSENNIRDIGDDITYNPNDNSIKKLTKDSEVITQYFDKKGNACGGSPTYISALVGLCSKGMPKDMNSDLYFQALVISQGRNIDRVYHTNTATRKAAVIIMTQKLKTQNLLDENNLTKGDICVYPRTNVGCGTLKKDDWISIPKEEMDRAIVEFENK